MPSLTSSLTDIDEVIANARRNSLTRDNPALADLPGWWESFRDHQRVAIREILTAYEEGAECVVLDAPTGCLSGDTDILVNRGGGARHLRLDKVVDRFNGGCSNTGNGNRKWDLSIPTMVQCADDDYLRLGKLKSAWCSGVKPVYLVKTATLTIKSTLTHPFLTEDGFELLGNLGVGSMVGTRGKRKAKGTYIKKHYQFDSRLYHHPYCSNRKTYSKGTDGWRVPRHRLVMEASINGVDFSEYIDRLRTGNIDGLVFLDPEIDAVHHKDGNSLNNCLANLEVLPHLEHWALEGREHAWKNCAFPVDYTPIIGIEYVGEEMTYDLEMEAEPHNFIANGYAVHNSGKTLIGETVRRLFLGTERFGQRSQCSYICSSKSLQDQFIRDYPYAKVLKGRSNYATEQYPERYGGSDSLSAADCTKQPGDPESCMWCVSTHLCPYERAKADALRSPLAVLNTSYFLSECNGPGRFSRDGFVIADEADTLESELLSHVEVRISERRLKGYGLGVPKYVTKEESWREWAEEAYETVRNTRPRPVSGDEVKTIRERKRHDILVGKLRELHEGLEVGGWVYTGDRTSVAFKPVTVDRLGKTKFWAHGSRFLLMSATVISADEMLESLGWDEDREWRLVKVPSTFPAENRKVVVWPVASMTFKEKDESIPKVVEAVRTIVERHPEDRILVHSTSYALTNDVVDGLRIACGSSLRPLLTYSQSADKDRILDKYLRCERSVLVAPSMDRGIDLPGEACRVQIICKVPFLSLKDKQVSARLYGTGRAGATWYAVNAIRTIVQMTGRAVRSEDDWAICYILDSQFVSNLWGKNKRLIPSWWREGLVWKMKGL